MQQARPSASRPRQPARRAAAALGAAAAALPGALLLALQQARKCLGNPENLTQRSHQGPGAVLTQTLMRLSQRR